jgi:bifunctional UDP-N-acetylglucosamine pyrophosphorylase/glucosamine-1-phosphate N-acetyltransferase
MFPGTLLSGKTRAGAGCALGPHAVIRDATLGNRVEVRASWVTGSRLDDDAAVGPFAHIRPGCTVGKGAHVGTHAEIVRTILGTRARMHHFSYLGDASVGPDANIGAGAVSANYDGRRKHPTRIGRGAFIGSGAVLVAPASIGDRAVVGAGSVVPAGRPVPARAVVAGVPARSLKRRKRG